MLAGPHDEPENIVTWRRKQVPQGRCAGDWRATQALKESERRRRNTERDIARALAHVVPEAPRVVNSLGDDSPVLNTLVADSPVLNTLVDDSPVLNTLADIAFDGLFDLRQREGDLEGLGEFEDLVARDFNELALEPPAEPPIEAALEPQAETVATPPKTVVTQPKACVSSSPLGAAELNVVSEAVAPIWTVGARVQVFWDTPTPGWYHGTVEAVGPPVRVMYDEGVYDLHAPELVKASGKQIPRIKRARGGGHIVDNKRRRSSARTCLPDAIHKGMSLIGSAPPLKRVREALDATFQDPSVGDAKEFLATQGIALPHRPGTSAARLFQSQGVFLARLELGSGELRTFHFLCVDATRGLVYDNCGPTWQLDAEDKVDNRAAVAFLRRVFPDNDSVHLRHVNELIRK